MPRVFLSLLRLFYFPLTFFLPSAASSPRDAFGRRKTFLNTSFLTTGNCRPRICDKLNLCIFFPSFFSP
uniref:Putative secreted protein n=1 Tax=Ixodes ricinus TaxID=34613 RepID=A0A6B0U1V6_IXORI